MLFLSAEVFITFALLTLQVDFFLPSFYRGKTETWSRVHQSLKGTDVLGG